MVLKLSFSVEGEKQVSRRLNMVADHVKDFDVPLRNIGKELLRSVDSNFSSRGALFGARWAPRKDNKPHPILEDSGAMRRGFKDNLGEGYVEIYNIEDYFKYHQSNQPRKKLPRRLMLKIDDIRKTYIVKQFQEHIQKALRPD